MSRRRATRRIIPGRCSISVGNPKTPLPPGWSWTRLTKVARLESGHTPTSRPENWAGPIPWLSVTDAREHHGGVIYETTRSITAAGVESSSARVLPAGTVCLSRTGSIGTVVITGRPMATSQDFACWVCSDDIDPRFLAYALMAEGRAGLRRFAEGSTKYEGVYFAEIEAFQVALAPVDEQRRIVSHLDRVRARTVATRAALVEALGLLDDLKASGTATTFSDAPQGASWATLADLAEVITVGHAGPMREHYRPEGIPFLRSLNVGENRIEPAGLVHVDPAFHANATRSAVRPRDMLTVRSGHPGRTCVVPPGLGECNVSDVLITRLRPGVNPDLVARWLNSPSGREQVRRLLVGTVQEHLNIRALRQVRVPVLDPARAAAVVARLRGLDEHLAVVQGDIESGLGDLDRLDEAVLKGEFSGEGPGVATDSIECSSGAKLSIFSSRHIRSIEGSNGTSST